MRYSIYYKIFIAVLPLCVYANGDSTPPLLQQPAPPPIEEIPTVKLSPEIQLKTLPPKPQKIIPIHLVRPFLLRPILLQSEQMETAPRVVGFVGERFIGSSGDEIYVSDKDYSKTLEQDFTNLEDSINLEELDAAGRLWHKFEIVRPGPPYLDPDTEEILGYGAIHVGNAILVKPGEPAHLAITGNSRVVRVNDLIFPILEEDSIEDIVPIPAPYELRGKILKIPYGSYENAANDVVAINLGAIDQVKPGHIFEVVRSPIRPRTTKDLKLPPTLPKEVIGIIVVFRSFERVSYALITKATLSIRPQDIIRGSGT